MIVRTKVCCFCEQWESGGIEAFLSNVIQHVDHKAVQVDIVAARLCVSVFTEPLQKKGVRFFELSGSPRALYQNHKRFQALLQAEKYDVVHLNIFHGLSLYYAKLAAQAGVPVRIAHSHNTALRRSRTRPLKRLIHNISKGLLTHSATALWACSAQAARFLFSRNALEEQGFRFIPNGIDTERFRFRPEVRSEVRHALELNGKFVIGHVGRLCYQKNQVFLLKIFAEFFRKNPNSRLLLVGEGEDSSMLRQRAKQLGIEDAVLFHGTTNQVEHLFWAMDIFAFPSLFEGLGIAAVEAQASGLTVFGSESVPQEAAVTPLFRVLPLKAGPDMWGSALAKADDFSLERQKYAEAVRSSGFDIRDIAKEIEAYWMR